MGSEKPSNIASTIYYLEGRRSLFLILLIRKWGIEMTLLTMYSQDSVEKYKIYVLKFLFPQYILVLKRCLDLKVRGA